MLSFYHKEFRDENHVMPIYFSGSRVGDGVAVSTDGETWYKVQGLTSVDGISSGWRRFAVDLDAAIADVGISSYNSAFKIKFQQYDNYPISIDGFAFDDVEVYLDMVDADQDGLADDWEMDYFGDLKELSDSDFDNDGLTNLAEFKEGTDPTYFDTDSDEMPDGWEVRNGLDPTDPFDANDDLDGDGINNLEEFLNGTDPTMSNTAAATFPFMEDFESGVLDSYWATRSTGAGSIAVSNAGNPHAGNFHLTMDSATPGSYSLNELILTIDLAFQTGVKLSFYHKEFQDENHNMPVSFTGSAQGDGIAISADGVAWYTVQGLTATDGISSNWRKFEIDLDAAIADAGISYTDAFKIKFQQYDNYPISTDGFAFDDVMLDVAPPTDPGNQNNLLPQELELITLINQQRQTYGLAPLRTDTALVSAARRHSLDMAQNNVFSHTGSDGSTPWSRMRDAGYNLGYGGENIAAGYPTPAGVLNGWMNSQGHRDNMLSPNFCDLGVGYAFGERSSYGRYWTLDLGCQR
ncbi:MAG: CAP domain-containing protein [Deltaproteobacteria bacterium]|nr:CAP domain-containing protein [Deltaproteobacteria bacterium]